MGSFILNNYALDLNNNDYCSKIKYITEPIPNSSQHSVYQNNNIHRKVMKKNSFSRYRSGSSSDSAINFDNTFEDNDEPFASEPIGLFNDFNSLVYNFACLALQQKSSLDSSIVKRVLDIIKRYYNMHEWENSFDKIGFMSNIELVEKYGDKVHIYLEYIINELLNTRACKYWSVNCESIKCLIREYGIPNHIRAQVWHTFISAKIDETINVKEILSNVSGREKDLTNSQKEVLHQIELDITRTFPNHHMFTDDAGGISKLRRILFGYCIDVNSKVGYCQGMNFIAALLLITFDGNEEISLKGLICIIDHYFPPHYYDHHLTGARADQMLLKDLILGMTSNMKVTTLTDQVFDELTNALSLNWFLSLFHSALPWQVRLSIIDCFWLEGVKVLFRFSLALIKIGLKSGSIDLNNSGELINAIRDAAKNCFDVFELKSIAFNDVKLPKRKYMASKRSFYVKQINIQFEKSMRETHKETTSQWIRRRSSELLGLKANNYLEKCRIVTSFDCTKVVVYRKNDKGMNELCILNTDEDRKSQITEGNIKNLFVIGISNDSKRIICSHYSSKTSTRVKDDIKINLIGVDFEVCEGFYLEALNSVIILGSSGLICKYKTDLKTFENIMILNDKSSKVVSADLDKRSKLIWLDILSNKNNTHKFLAFNLATLDIYTVINTDCFSIHKFSIVNNYKNTLVIVKSAPINGKLMKAIDILTNSTKKERVYDSNEEIFDVQCYSFLDQNKELVLNSLDFKSIDTTIKDKTIENFIVLVTKYCSSIAIEYKYNNYWKKKIITIEKMNDISEINAIKIVRLLKDKTEFNITLLVYTSVSQLINFKFIVDN